MNNIVNDKRGHKFKNDKNHWFSRKNLEYDTLWITLLTARGQNYEWHKSSLGRFYEWHYEWQKVTIMNDTGVAQGDFMNDIMNDKRSQLWMTQE